MPSNKPSAIYVYKRRNPILLFFCVFVSLVFFLLPNSLVFRVCFCLFSRVLRVRMVRRILGVFKVFLGIFERPRKRRGQGSRQKIRVSVPASLGSFSGAGTKIQILQKPKNSTAQDSGDCLQEDRPHSRTRTGQSFKFSGLKSLGCWSCEATNLL